MLAINEYMAQVLTSKAVREYVLKLYATFISGQVKEQKFYIWTGSGSNSKSVLVELFEKSYGDYCCKFPITLLTQKRCASNAANSELARAKGKRFACLQEPSEDEKINIGLMKELSGGDKIMARALYKEPFEFVPQFKMLLLCNQLPHVPSDDGGTWRRIRVVEFTSKFVEEPSGPNEFVIDYDLTSRMEEWREHFMALLIHYYKKYQVEGITEPAEVMKCTTDYKSQNDHMAYFMHTYFEKKDSAFLSLDEAHVELRNYIKDDAIPIKMMSKPELDRYMVKHMSKCVVNCGVKGYKGWRLKCAFPEAEEGGANAEEAGASASA
jgi:P4 family phage/plasmid primase-like protien